MNTIKLKKNALFNPEGDTDLRHRRMIGGNTTNLNDFNNMPFLSRFCICLKKTFRCWIQKFYHKLEIDNQKGIFNVVGERF